MGVFKPQTSRKDRFYGESNELASAHEMDVQVSHRLLPQVSEKGDIWTVSGRSAGDNPDTMQVQGRGDIGRPHDAGSRTPSFKYPTEIQCIRSDGISQRKERTDDLRQTRKPEV